MNKIVIILILFSLSSCASQVTSTPLQDAMVSTVNALAVANIAAMRSGIAGLAPCDVTASFALTSSTSGNLDVALKPPMIPVGIEGGGSHGRQTVNTVTVDFKSPACVKAMQMKFPKIQ